MAQKTGTYDVSALLAAQTPIGQEFDQESVARSLQADNDALGEAINSALSDLVEVTKDRERTVASSIGGDMQEVDEYGQGPTQKDTPGYLVYFPLRKFQFPVGWTRQWEKSATVADYAIKNNAAQGASLRRLREQLQRAIYTPTNYTYRDHLVDNATLNVKAFINADSTAMSNGPNGEVFDGTTHTHYDGVASLSAAALAAQVADIVEHRNGAKVRININTADVATVAALTGYTPLQVPIVTINANANQIADPRLDITRPDNRLVGYFNGYEVWTKPWAIANYSVAYDADATAKPLVRRTEKVDRGLHIAAELESHPLRAQFVEQFYGFGAWNRVAVHVLKFNNATYSAPTFSY